MIQRWTAKRKAGVIEKIRAGETSRAVVCSRFAISSEELSDWERRYETGGIRALRVTRRPTDPDYLKHIPATVPPGSVVVHNNVKPARQLGSRGFRTWLASSREGLVICECGWAPQLPEHYRVVQGK
jgi:hypothetical protein